MSPPSPSPSLDAVGGRSSSSTSQQYDIHDLRHLSPPSASLLSQLRAGLQPSAWLGEADDPWRFTKSLPTMLLYDERGLQIYEKITTDVPEYYLYPTELGLLKKHSREIVEVLFPDSPASSSSAASPDGSGQHHQQGHNGGGNGSRRAPVARWRVGDWGSDAVGKHNGGVNAEEGLDGESEGQAHGKCQTTPPADVPASGLEGVVLELGAGSLSKTSYLLSALSHRHGDRSADTHVQYLALDLDQAELVRTIDTVAASSFGKEMQAGNVAIGGVWGTFDAGLQWVSEGHHLPAAPSGGTDDSDEEADLLVSSASADRSAPIAIKRNGHGRRRSESEDSRASSVPGQSFPTLQHSLPPSPPHSPEVRPAAGSDSPPRAPLGLGDGARSSASGADAPTASADVPTHFLFLGSSLGNFTRPAAAEFLRSIPLRAGSGDCLVLGLDGRNDQDVVERAYNDPQGITREWAENMWNGVEKQVNWAGPAGTMKDTWQYEGRYDVKEGRHEAFFRSLKAQTLHIPADPTDDLSEPLEVAFAAGELVNIEWSYKYSQAEVLTLFESANLRPITRFNDPGSSYNLWVLQRPPFQFPSLTKALAAPVAADEASLAGQMGQHERANTLGVPRRDEWEDLWHLWDTVTLGMIKAEKLHEKPIDLRHKNLFYLGHIPTFCDIFLSRFLKESHTDPEFFKDIFERGIDPIVDDPTSIHPHSIVPEKDEDWPTLDEILGFRDRVRQRILSIYDDIDAGRRKLSRRLGRVLFMCMEHEAMHAETLLYMLVQSADTLPPPGFATPHWSSLARVWDAQHERDQAEPSRVAVGPTTVTLGLADREADDGQFPDARGWNDHVFGWDLEGSERDVSVGPIEVERKPITNGEYKAFLERTGSTMLPVSWVDDGGVWKVKTVFGPVDFAVAQHWPLMASYKELDAVARSKGGRLPTEAELRAWLEHAEGDRVDWEGSNTGLKNWHPIPAELSHDEGTGRVPGHNGGVWEFTSTPLDAHAGFEAGELYPGYSTDFFDGVHNVVLGGSCLTVPRIASRASFKNYYQASYGFAWTGGRVVYDL